MNMVGADIQSVPDQVSGVCFGTWLDHQARLMELVDR